MSVKTDLYGELMWTLADRLPTGIEMAASIQYVVEKIAVYCQEAAEGLAADEGGTAAGLFLTSQYLKEALEHSVTHLKNAMLTTSKLAPAGYGLTPWDSFKENTQRAVAAVSAGKEPAFTGPTVGQS